MAPEADDLVLRDLERPLRAEPQRVVTGYDRHLDCLLVGDRADHGAVDPAEAQELAEFGNFQAVLAFLQEYESDGGLFFSGAESDGCTRAMQTDPVTRLRASRWVAPAAGGASLLATAMVTAALFLPFVSQGCAGCSAFYGTGLPVAALRASPDGWAVVWILGILASTAVLFLADVAVRLMAMVSAVASVATLGVAIFEGAVAFPRILAAAELVPGVPVYYVLDPGYYLFLIGGAAAVGAAAAMFLVGDDERIGPRALGRPWATVAVGWACLVVLAIAFAGAFLPFVALNCGFGCPAFVGPPPGTFSGAIVASADGLIVLILLVAAALATTVRLASHSKALASITALLLALAATATVSFDSLNGATRVLGWPFAIPTSPEHGYFLIQVGSALAVVLSFVLVATDRPTWRLHRGVGFRGREATRSA